MSKEKVEIKNTPIDGMTLDSCTFLDGSVRKARRDGPLDSMEEWYFVCYLKELMEAGVVLDADKNEGPIDLLGKTQHVSTEYMATKTKPTFRHLLHPVHYTPDFNIQWNPEWKDSFFSLLNAGKHKKGHKVPFITCKSNIHSSIIECKGKFMNVTEKSLCSTRIKWVYEKHAMYVQLCVVPNMFKESFTPQAYIDDMKYKRANQNKGIKVGDSRLKYEPVTCADYLESIKDFAPKQTEML